MINKRLLQLLTMTLVVLWLSYAQTLASDNDRDAFSSTTDLSSPQIATPQHSLNDIEQDTERLQKLLEQLLQSEPLQEKTSAIDTPTRRQHASQGAAAIWSEYARDAQTPWQQAVMLDVTHHTVLLETQSLLLKQRLLEQRSDYTLYGIMALSLLMLLALVLIAWLDRREPPTDAIISEVETVAQQVIDKQSLTTEQESTMTGRDITNDEQRESAQTSASEQNDDLAVAFKHAAIERDAPTIHVDSASGGNIEHDLQIMAKAITVDDLAIEFGSHELHDRTTRKNEPLDYTVTGDDNRDDTENNITMQLNLARAYMDMGDREKAAKILETLIRFGPDEYRQEAQMLLQRSAENTKAK